MITIKMSTKLFVEFSPIKIIHPKKRIVRDKLEKVQCVFLFSDKIGMGMIIIEQGVIN